MDKLFELIHSMKKEDVRHFKLYLSRQDYNSERIDLQLFDLVRKSRDKSEDKFFQKLYNGKNKNAYYRLKNRLAQEIDKSILLQQFNKDDQVNLYHLLALSRYYFSRNYFDLSFHYLKRSEKKALQLENFELLDIIYGEYIRFSQQLLSINPEKYIAKRQENREKIIQLREIDDLLVIINYRLKISQTFSSKNESIISLLESLLKKYTTSKTLHKSTTFRLKIYESVSSVLLEKQDFKALTEYILKTYGEFEKEELFTRATHNQKLQMLTYLVNSLYKINRIKESLKWAEILKKAMSEYNNLLYDKYYFFYYNSLVINYSRKEIQKAINILEKLKTDEKIRQFSFYKVFIYLNLSLLLFMKKDYSRSFKHINKLYLLKEYRTLDVSVKLKVVIAELIIRYELGDYEVLRRRIRQVKKDFVETLGQKNYLKEKEFVNLLNRLNERDAVRQDKALPEDVREYGKRHPQAQPRDDNELINYYTWLCEKLRLPVDKPQVAAR